MHDASQIIRVVCSNQTSPTEKFETKYLTNCTEQEPFLRNKYLLSYSTKFLAFTESDGSVPCSQNPACGLSYQANSTLNRSPSFLKIQFNIHYNLCIGVSRCLFRSAFQTIISQAFMSLLFCSPFHLSLFPLRPLNHTLNINNTKHGPLQVVNEQTDRISGGAI